MLVQITNAGIALMQGAATPLVMTSFKLGSGVGYVPTATQTDIQGTEVYAGTPALPVNAASNELLYACQVPSPSGPFQFGEIGLYYGSQLFAICVLDTLVNKLPLDVNFNTGGPVVVDFFIPITSSNYQMWANVTQANTLKASTVVGPEGLPPSPNAIPNLFVVEPAGSGSTFLAITDRFGVWSFTGFGQVASLTVLSATAHSVTVSAASVAAITFQGLGTLLSQFTTGAAYSASRYIDAVTPNGPTVVLSVSAPFVNLPNAGDTLVLYEPTVVATPSGSTGPGVFTALTSTGATHLGATTAGSIDNTPIGQTGPEVGKFTNLVAGTSTLGAVTASALDATPIGQTTAAPGKFTSLVVTTSFSGNGIAAMFSAPNPIGSVTPNSGVFTNLSSTGQTSLGAVTATAINATPIGQATAAPGAFTALSASGATTLAGLVNSGNSVLQAVTATSVTASGAGSFASLTISGSATFASLNNTPVGATTAASGKFTTLQATGATTLAAVTAGAVTATSLDSTPIGAGTASTGKFTTLQATGATTLAAVTAGAVTATSLDATPIGATTASTGKFTTLQASGAATLGGLVLSGTASAVTLNASAGTAGQVLTSAGPGATPTWTSVAAAGSSPSFANLTVTGTSALGTATATALNSTPIGATTASTGKFTTLQATSTLAVGGVMTLSSGIQLEASQGTAGQVLTSAGAGLVPTWTSVVAAGSSPTFTNVTVTGTVTTDIATANQVTATTVNIGTLNLTGNTRLQINGSAGNAGQVLISQGAGAAPVWQNFVATNAAFTSGTINGVVIGGVSPAAGSFTQLSLTGAASPVLLSGQSGTAGQVLTSAGPGATPTWTTLSGGGGASTVTITGGTINGVTIGSSVPGDATFVNLTATGITSLQTTTATQVQAQQLTLTADQPFLVNGSPGTSGYVLTSTGNATAPAWQAPTTPAVAALTSGTISGVVLTNSLVDATPIGRNVATDGTFTTVTATNGIKTTQLATPTVATGLGSTAGGSLAADTYYVKIVAVDINGHTTLASPESASVTTTGSTSSIAYTWTPVAGASSYQVWFSNVAGGQVAYFTSAAAAFTLTTTTGGTAGTLPVANTTGSLVVAGAASFGSFSIAALNDTQIGNTTPSTGAFTTLSATGTTMLAAVSTTGLTLAGTTSAIKLNAAEGTAGQVLTSAGPGATPTWSNPASSSVAAFTSGTINGVTIGATTASTGKFTTLEATGVTLAGTTSTLTLNASVGTAGQVLTSAGPGATPTWTTPAGGGGTPGGANTQLQFNNSGVFGGIPTLTWNGTIFASSADIFISGLRIGKGNGSDPNSVAVGLDALNPGTAYTATRNVAIGWKALQSVQTSSDNVAIGPNVLSAQTVGASGGGRNIGIGSDVMSGSTAQSSARNVAIGFQACSGASFDATDCVAVGNTAGNSLTTGGANIIIGSLAGTSITNGANNVIVGTNAGKGNASGSVCIGGAAGFQNSGANNTYVGFNAGSAATTGGNNVIIGSYDGSGAPFSANNSGNIVFSDGAANIRLYYASSNGAWNSNAAFNEAAIATIASAATTNIAAGTANTLNVTGTTTITAFGTVNSGALRCLVFGGSLTLTHNATSLILPTGANIQTAAGDIATFVSLGSGNWRCLSYQRAVGSSLTPRVVVLTDAVNIALNAQLGDSFRVVLGGNRTLDNPTNLTDGQVVNLRIKQDATGNRTLAYGSKFKFPGGVIPVLSTAANAMDFASMQYDAVDDTILFVLNKAFN